MSARMTDQQRDAAHAIDADLCVDAGAGSGKTTVLVERIMHLLDRGVDLRRIVAITFTRKAAGEMKERLREAIHRRPENDPRSMDKWRALELDVQTARISTIDGFCASLLHEHALPLELDPDFVTLSEDEALLLRSEIAETTLASLLDDGEGPAQRLVVEHGLANVTDFLAQALNQITRFKAASAPYAGFDGAAVVTAWAAQAEALQHQRYRELASAPVIANLIAALNVYTGQCEDPRNSVEILRRETLGFLGLIAGQQDAGKIHAGVIGLSGINLRARSTKGWPSEDAMKSVKELAEEARILAKSYLEPKYEPLAEHAAAQLTLDLIDVFGKIDRAYAEAKRARTALDFADLLTRTVAMLENRPELRARVAGGIDHLLIDEFQDTNHAQLRLATLLTGDGGAKLFVVGDAKQSIYRFRGAEVEVFAEAKKATHQTKRLDENFRSLRPLIEFINDFFHDSGLLAKVEPEFLRLNAARTANEDACVEFLLSEKVETDDEDSSEPRAAEAALIAGRIAELCGPDGVHIFDKERNESRPARFGDVAILYRAVTHASTYEEALRRLNIPANVIAGAGFYARQEILDIHNLFTAALDPWNEPALAAFLRSPLAGVTDDTLFRMTREANLAEAFWRRVKTGDNTEDAILQRAHDLIGFIQARREWPVAALMRALLKETGIEAILLAQHHGVQKASNLHKLNHLAREFGGSGRLGLHAFTDHLSTLARRGLRAGDAELFAETGGAVTLMTVHNAKGLEFPIVVIADMGREPGGGRTRPFCLLNPRHGLTVATHDANGNPVWPAIGQHLKRLDTEDDLAEEARVLYVAMTRARDRLLLAGPAKPRKHSWMAALNAAYALENRGHDNTFSGAAWTARVIRCASTTPLAEVREPVPALPPIETLREQAREIPLTIAPGQTIPARTVLDWLHPDAEETTSDSSPRKIPLDQQKLGTAAHALLERWDFAGDPPVSLVAREHFPNAPDHETCTQALNEIANRIKASTLWPRLQRATNLRRELPFLFDLGGAVINGVMDVWLDSDTLIDYKLNSPKSSKARRYESQLRLYAAAVRAATGSAPREAFLFYLDSGEMHPVDVTDQALDEIVAQANTVLQARTAAVSRPAQGRRV